MRYLYPVKKSLGRERITVQLHSLRIQFELLENYASSS